MILFLCQLSSGHPSLLHFIVNAISDVISALFMYVSNVHYNYKRTELEDSVPVISFWVPFMSTQYAGSTWKENRFPLVQISAHG